MKTIAMIGACSTLLLCSNSASAVTMGDRADTVAGLRALRETVRLVCPPKAPIIIIRRLVVEIVKVLF